MEKVYIIETKYISGFLSDKEFIELAKEKGQVLTKEEFKDFPPGKSRIRFLKETDSQTIKL